MLLFGKLAAAMACSAPNRPSDEEVFAKASAVFVAHIYRTEEFELPGAGGDPAKLAVTANFRLAEVLKGQPPADGKVKSPLVLFCATPLLAGFDYVVFLGSDNFILQELDKGTQLLLELSPGIEDKLCVSKQCRVDKLREIARRMQ